MVQLLFSVLTKPERICTLEFICKHESWKKIRILAVIGKFLCIEPSANLNGAENFYLVRSQGIVELSSKRLHVVTLLLTEMNFARENILQSVDSFIGASRSGPANLAKISIVL